MCAKEIWRVYVCVCNVYVCNVYVCVCYVCVCVCVDGEKGQMEKDRTFFSFSSSLFFSSLSSPSLFSSPSPFVYVYV